MPKTIPLLPVSISLPLMRSACVAAKQARRNNMTSISRFCASAEGRRFNRGEAINSAASMLKSDASLSVSFVLSAVALPVLRSGVRMIERR